MGKLVLISYFVSGLMCAICMDSPVDTTNGTALVNSTDPNKDMYVIHAMVYQVGILTNKTDNDTANLNTTGNQEALTFYHNNGSQVDLTKIPAPLLTNVTAQSIVGVAPVSNSLNNASNQLPWSTLNHLTKIAAPANSKQGVKEVSVPIKSVRDTNSKLNFEDNTEQSFDNLYRSLFKREASGDDTSVAVRKGAAVIPQTAGVQSIAIPPLLTLNNNLSQIPVPIPNTSVVHYAKINTLVSKP